MERTVYGTMMSAAGMPPVSVTVKTASPPSLTDCDAGPMVTVTSSSRTMTMTESVPTRPWLSVTVSVSVKTLPRPLAVTSGHDTTGVAVPAMFSAGVAGLCVHS